MARFNKENRIGGWTFLIGVLLAIILGAMHLLDQTWITVLVLIGLVVGFLNITGSEVQPFMMSGIVLIIASAFGNGVLQSIVVGGETIASDILTSLLAIFVPATIVVAVKNVFTLAKR